MFSSAVATTWQQFRDSLALKPITSHISDATTTMERIGTVKDLPTKVEEGTLLPDDKDDDSVVDGSLLKPPTTEAPPDQQLNSPLNLHPLTKSMIH